MPFIEFTPEEKVNVKIIDEQHEQLAALFNVLHSNLDESKRDLAAKTLNAIIDLVEKHFFAEERLMKQFRFTGYFSHKLEHDRFYNKLLLLTDKYKKGEESITERELDGFKQWFHNHIELNDKKCGEFLSTQGIN